MIYFYYGEDSYRAKQTIRELKKKFIKLYDPSGHNVDVIDQDEFSMERFFTSIKASGFLAAKKLVIIENIFSHKKFGDIQDVIIQFLKTQKNTKEENYLVFWQEGEPRRNTKLFKFLTKLCEPLNCCKNFETLKEKELIQWVQKEAQQYKKTMTNDAADLLVSLIGDNTWHLHHEVHKLVNFVSNEKIEADDVQKCITTTHADSIFSLVDAMSSRKKQQALQLLEDYLQRNSDMQYLISMIIRQFRLTLYAKEAGATTQNSYAIAQRLQLHPFVAKKMLQHSAYFTKKELETIYRDLMNLDRILKSDPCYLGTALTLFVSKL